VIIVSELKRLQ